MAGIATGSTAQHSPVPTRAPRANPAALAGLHLVHTPAAAPTADTRTRRNHGAFSIGGQLACVYSTRSAGRCFGVRLEVGAGTLALSTSMTACQARTFARALVAAADALARVELQAQQGGAA